VQEWWRLSTPPQHAAEAGLTQLQVPPAQAASKQHTQVHNLVAAAQGLQLHSTGCRARRGLEMLAEQAQHRQLHHARLACARGC
jgi:hypothetical protein